MNSITWEIEPNLLAWGLLIVATGALCWIACLLRRLPKGNTPLANHALNSPQSAWRNVERTITWLSFALVLIGIGYLTTIGKQEAKVADFSALATVMGVLVTLLVGWNIWQAIDSKDTLSEVARLRAEFDDLRRETNTLHEIQEAYALNTFADTLRRNGQSHLAFDSFLRSALIFVRDVEHYSARAVAAIGSMRASLDDLGREALGSRDVEIERFVETRNSIIRDLEELRNQTDRLTQSSEQAVRQVDELINRIQNLQRRPNPNPTPDERR